MKRIAPSPAPNSPGSVQHLLDQLDAPSALPSTAAVAHPRQRGEARKATLLVLQNGDSVRLEALRHSGINQARSINRAHILAALASGVHESILKLVLGSSRSTIWRVRKTYEAHGLARAIEDAPRAGRPKGKLKSAGG